MNQHGVCVYVTVTNLYCSCKIFVFIKTVLLLRQNMAAERDTVMRKMQKVEDMIQHAHHRIGVLEKKLAQGVEFDNLDEIESELRDAKKVLKRSEKELKELRKKNLNTYVIVACLIVFPLVVFLLYGIITSQFDKTPR